MLADLGLLPDCGVLCRRRSPAYTSEERKRILTTVRHPGRGEPARAAPSRLPGRYLTVNVPCMELSCGLQ
jgi:hypothetical protein